MRLASKKEATYKNVRNLKFDGVPALAPSKGTLIKKRSPGFKLNIQIL